MECIAKLTNGQLIEYSECREVNEPQDGINSAMYKYVGTGYIHSVDGILCQNQFILQNFYREIESILSREELSKIVMADKEEIEKLRSELRLKSRLISDHEKVIENRDETINRLLNENSSLLKNR